MQIRGSEAVSIKSALCAIAMCLASSVALAQPLPPGAVAGLGPVMPPQQIGKILRANGFVPQATPVRNGEAYQVRAIDRRGLQVRVAIDARYGDILMVRRIIMVPPGAIGPRPYGPPPGYYDDDLPTGAVGAYPPHGAGPPAGRTATLAPAHPPIPRPKPAVKPVAVTPAPAAASEATPAAASEAKPAAATPPAPTTAAAAPAPAVPPASAPPASTPPATAAAPPAAMPPVAPLE
jgi:hypothetical protein